MNKTIKEASLDEIKQAFQRNAIYLIASYRKQSITREIIEDTGEIITYHHFTRKTAENYNLGFEFRLWVANKGRRNRLEKRVRDMIFSNKAIFLTLTFNDRFLGRDTSPETRRRYIRRFLREQCSDYVANIDFGVDDRFTQREHYHALVIPKNDKIDFSSYREFFNDSSINAKRVRDNEKSVIGVANYVNKLTNHALKDNGRYQRLIYSRS